MKEASVKFDFDGYTIYATGIVYSPGHIEDVEVDFEGVNIKNISKYDIKIAKELAKEELVSIVYEQDLFF